MKYNVMLSLRGCQTYENQEPDVIELVTEGVMEQRDGGWDISYQESELTGLAGVTTTFQIEPGKITLSRTGPLRSQMVFQEGLFHESLYEMQFGAMMVTVCASRVSYDITPAGGTVDIVYGIEIEQSAIGVVDYHLEIQTIS